MGEVLIPLQLLGCAQFEVARVALRDPGRLQEFDICQQTPQVRDFVLELSGSCCHLFLLLLVLLKRLFKLFEVVGQICSRGGVYSPEPPLNLSESVLRVRCGGRSWRLLALRHVARRRCQGRAQGRGGR